MAGNPRLRLPTGRRTALYRALESILRADPELKRVVRDSAWKTWGSGASDDDPPTPGQCPWVRLTPTSGPAAPRDEQSQVATLTVRVELATAGLWVDDAADLWDALVAAIYPPDTQRQNAIRQRLKALGADTGVVKIGQPAVAPRPGEALTMAEGAFSVDYRINS